MKWCSVSQIWSKPSSSVHSICSSSRCTTSAWLRPGAAWKKKKVPKRMRSAPDACEMFERRDDGGQVLVAMPRGRRRGTQLMGDAGERQRHAEALGLLQHEAEVLQIEVETDVRVEAMAHHERA